MAQTPGKVFRLGTEGAAAVQRDFAATGAAGAAMGKKITEGAKSVPPALRALDTAVGQAKGQIEGLSGSAGALGKVLTSMGPLGLAAAAGVGAAGLAFGALSGAAKGAADELKLLSGSALQANVSVEFLQEMRAAATALGRDVAVVEPALKTFAVRLGEISGGIGQSSLAVLATVGISEAQVRSFKNAEDGLLQLSDALSKVDDATAFNVADKLGLVDLIPVLRDGSGQFEKMAASARAAGLIIEESVVKNAAQTAVEWDRAQSIVNVQLKKAALDAAPAFLELAKAAADVARFFGDAVTSFKKIEDRPLADKRARVDQILDAQADLRRRFGPGVAVGGNPDGGFKLDAFETSRDLYARYTRERDVLIKKIREQQADLDSAVSAPTRGAPILPALPGAGGGGGGATSAPDATLERLQREADALAAWIAQVDAASETAAAFAKQKALMAGASDAEVQATLDLKAALDKLNDARRVGVIASDAELEARKAALQAEFDEAQSFRRREEAFARVADLVRATVGPSEIYADSVRALDDAMAEGAITAEEYARGIEEAKLRLSEMSGDIAGLEDRLGENADRLVDGLSRTLEDAIRSGQKLDKDGIKALLAQFWRDVIYDVFVADSLSDLQKLATGALKSFIQKVIGGASQGNKTGSFLGGLVGSIFGAFGGKGGTKAPAPKVGVPKGSFSFAATGGSPTGLTWVGERGPELLDLPFGSRVFDAATSQAMAAKANAGAGARNVTFAPTIVAAGASQADIEAALATAQERFMSEIRRVEGSIDGRAVGAYREARRRGYLKP
jgi:hypothetical protein